MKVKAAVKIINELANVRIKKGITSDELAKMINVSGQTIRNWEHFRRDPKLTNIVKWCDALQFNPFLGAFVENRKDKLS